VAYETHVGGDELHGPYRVVKNGITVEHAVIGVQDEPGANAVQRDADDARGGEAIGEEYRAGVAAMIGLDAADCGQKGPRESAAGGSLVGKIGGVLVGPRCDRGNPVTGQR